jgi:hypothetical protein
MSPSPIFDSAPRGCYATEEWYASFTDDNGVHHAEECVEYTHPIHGVVGCLAYKYINEEFVSVEWVAYDPNLAL